MRASKDMRAYASVCTRVRVRVLGRSAASFVTRARVCTPCGDKLARHVAGQHRGALAIAAESSSIGVR